MASSQQAPVTGGSRRQTVPFVVRLDPPNAPYTNAQEYLRAVDHRDLPQTIRDCLHNDTELDHYIACALRTARVQRPLEFKPGVNPGNHQHFSTLRPWYNLHAAFVYITGNLNTPPCQSKGLAGRVRTGPCANMFPRCVVPRGDLVYVSGAKFNTTACANHQYQCEGSRCVLGGIAQTQIAQTQATIAQAQPAAVHFQPVVPLVPTVQMMIPMTQQQFSAFQVAGHQHGPGQTIGSFNTAAPHAAANLAASPYAPSIQAQASHTYPEGAADSQDHAAQEYVDARWDQEHDEHDLAGQDSGASNMYSEPFVDPDFFPLEFQSQAFQLPVSADVTDHHTVLSQAPAAHGHGPSAYAAQADSAEEHTASHQLSGASHNAPQPDQSDSEHVDQ